MIIPIGYTQINLKFTGTGAPTGAEMTFGVKNNIPATPTIIAAAVATEWDAAGMNDWQSTDVTLSSVLAKNGPNSTGPSAEVAVTVTGTNSAADPPQSAVLISKATALGGRQGRGRFYLPGVPGNALTADGQITTAYQGFLQTACDDFLSNLAAADIPMYLLHADGTAPFEVLSLAVQSRSGTQRRRNRR